MIEQFRTKTGAMVQIEIDESDFSATVTDSNGSRIGEIIFSYAEGPMPNDGGYLTMINAHLEKQGTSYLHQGIGTRCIELMIEVTGLPICAQPNDGIVREDGSHLTGDAPIWVAKLKEKGLVFDC